MTYLCDCCGKQFPLAALHTDNRFRICDGCYQRSYTRCTACYRMIHREDAYLDHDAAYCFGCYERLFRFIHQHDYKPSPVFYGGIPRYFGIELEIDDGGHSDENARLLLEAVNTNAEYIYIKTDSSLRDGLEIVTHPMTLEFHLHCFDWAKPMDTARQLGYRADDTETCGLHIHVNRNSLGNTAELQEQSIRRILAFRLYSTELVVQMRSQIFRQIV